MGKFVKILGVGRAGLFVHEWVDSSCSEREGGESEAEDSFEGPLRPIEQG